MSLNERTGVFAGAIGPVETDPETIAAAARYLHANAARLKPIDGWKGNVVDGYLDALGLNGRPIRSRQAAKAKDLALPDSR